MTAAQLAKLRAKLGMTQEELAEHLGVTRNSVARWEMGRHPISARTERALKLLQQTVTKEQG